jgi:hypothetical protein
LPIRRRFWFVLSVLGVLVLGQPFVARAGNAIRPLAEGPKANGRGGAATAVPDDGLSGANNPALIGLFDRTRIDASFLFFSERTRKRTPFTNELDETFLPIPLPTFGVVFGLDSAPEPVVGPNPTGDPELGRPLPPERESSNVRIGFGLYQPMALVYAPTVSAAVRVTDTLTLGASFHVLLTYITLDGGGTVGGGGGGVQQADFLPEGKMFVHRSGGNPVVPPQPFDAGTGTQVTWGEVFQIAASGPAADPNDPEAFSEDEAARTSIKLEGVFGVGISGTFGAVWQPHSDLNLGVSIQTPGIIFNPRGTGEIDLNEAIQQLNADPEVGGFVNALIETFVPDGGANGFAADYDVETDYLYVPPTVSLGVGWWPTARWMLAMDVRWVGWKGFFNDITLEAKNGTNNDFNEITGGADFEYKFRLDWDSQFVVAVGTAVGVTDWLTLRAGYNYGSNPIPQSTLEATSLVIEHHLTLGASAHVSDWSFDLAWVWGLPTEGRINRSETTFKTEQNLVYLGAGYTF